MGNVYRHNRDSLFTTALMSSVLRFDPRRHLLVKLGVFQNLATHYDRSESGLRRKTVPLHRSEMSNQMSVDIKKKERNHLLSLPLHDGLQTVHRTVLRLSKNRDSLTNSWLISMCFPGITFPDSDNVPQRLVFYLSKSKPSALSSSK